MTNIEAVLIAGPTASGKSAFALEIAEDRNGVVINADSMQVYEELKILTARPSEADEARAPHRLYGFVPACDAYSAGRWIEDVSVEIGECQDAGKLPVIVGGTGLYFSALLEGLSPIPDIPEGIRNYWREKAWMLGSTELFEILRGKDPETASKLRPSDPQRIVRALEVIDATGKSLTDWQKTPGKPLLDKENVEKIVISPSREALYRRCDARFDKMMTTGALDEVRRLIELNLSPDLPAMRALGVRPLIEYLEGRASCDTAMELAKTETRRYAKRQLTWLRRNMIAWNWIKK